MKAEVNLGLISSEIQNMDLIDYNVTSNSDNEFDLAYIQIPISYIQAIKYLLDILFYLQSPLASFLSANLSVTNQPPLQVFVTGNGYLTIIDYRHSLRSLLRLLL